MLVLGIETSTRRGSVAIVENGREVRSLHYEADGGHGEHLLAVVESVLSQSGVARTSLDRIAVGLGPGSFTGLRIGIALAQGVALGLGRPLFGVCSLRAMAAAVPAHVPGLRCPLLDARREEVFAALYDSDGTERLAPQVLARSLVEDQLGRGGTVAFTGEAAPELSATGFRSFESDLPHAVWTARLAETLPEGSAAADPLYLRPVDAIRPNLPPSPLSSGEAPP